MKITLDMSQIIQLLNGKEVTVEGAVLRMNREDTSITAKGAVERIEGEWRLTLEDLDGGRV